MKHKVVIEVTAPSDGVMGKVLVKEGATIKSSEVIGSYNEGELKMTQIVVRWKVSVEKHVEIEKS